jgi:hypothetical protein
MLSILQAKHRKPLRIILLAATAPVTPLESYSYQNIGGTPPCPPKLSRRTGYTSHSPLDYVPTDSQCFLSLTDIPQKTPQKSPNVFYHLQTATRVTICVFYHLQKRRGGRGPGTPISRSAHAFKPPFRRMAFPGLFFIQALRLRGGIFREFSPLPITHAKSITYSGKYSAKSLDHPFTNGKACGTLGMLCCSVVALDQKHLGCGARSAAFFVSGRSTHPNGENGSRIKLH